jgi:hypothetical protein
MFLYEWFCIYSLSSLPQLSFSFVRHPVAVKVVFYVAVDNPLYVIVVVEQVPACRRPNQCRAVNHASVYPDTEQCPKELLPINILDQHFLTFLSFPVHHRVKSHGTLLSVNFISTSHSVHNMCLNEPISLLV